MIFNRTKRYRRLGDRHRDLGDWNGAETQYRRHLGVVPEDAAIWVQLGHALKEQGRIAGALDAYLRAAAIEPGNSDTERHLQFAQEQTGPRSAPQGAAYAVPSMVPTSPTVGASSAPVVVRHRKTVPLQGGIILFSLQDLFGYLQAHVTMSGIQRVQAGIALHAIANDGDHVGFILNDMTPQYRDGEFLLVDKDALKSLLLYASDRVVDHHMLRSMLLDSVAKAVIVRPRAGTTIVLLGAFWGHGNTIDRYVTAKGHGAKIGCYIYDIIPITHPQYCDERLVADFTMSICELGSVVDFIFTISDYTRDVLSKFYHQNGMRDISMVTVPLAHSLTTTRVGDGQDWPSALDHIRDRPYVAYISTLEGRKNHAYVILAWQELISEGVSVPDLVFVGRRGWRINGLLDLLDGTRNLGGRVHVVHDLSDVELNAVYARCEFTVFTSFVEGWGLPIGESLVHNVPCVASSTSSIPEVGGHFVDYVDPLNLRDGMKTFRRMIEDTAYLAQRRDNIARSFVPRTWNDVGRDFIDKTRRAAAGHYPARLVVPTLSEGWLFRPAELVDTVIQASRYARCPARLLLAKSFYGAESFGAWMRGNAGSIIFSTDAAPGEAVVVYVELTAGPESDGRDVVVQIDGATPAETGIERPYRIDPDRRTILRVHGTVSAERNCTVRIAVSGEIGSRGDDTRQFVVGLAAIGYARSANRVARDDLVEQFFLHDIEALK